MAVQPRATWIRLPSGRSGTSHACTRDKQLCPWFFYQNKIIYDNTPKRRASIIPRLFNAPFSWLFTLQYRMLTILQGSLVAWASFLGVGIMIQLTTPQPSRFRQFGLTGHFWDLYEHSALSPVVESRLTSEVSRDRRMNIRLATVIYSIGKDYGTALSDW